MPVAGTSLAAMTAMAYHVAPASSSLTDSIQSQKGNRNMQQRRNQIENKYSKENIQSEAPMRLRRLRRLPCVRGSLLAVGMCAMAAHVQGAETPETPEVAEAPEVRGVRESRRNATARPSAALSPVNVSSERDKIAEKLNPETTVGSKLPLTQREIPQTVNVLSSEQIDQQKILDLNHAVLAIPGITSAQVNVGQANFYSRGFPVDIIQLDGIPFNIKTSANGLTNLNLAMYDRVESLDGPAGLLSGFGGAGGALNLVRKRAQRDFALSADVSYGSGSDRRQSLDVTGPLNEAGTVRGRFVQSAQDTHLPQDGTFKKQALLYGVIEADVTPTTLVSVGASYQRLFQKAMHLGYPAYSNTRMLSDPSLYIGSADNRQSFTTTTVFGSIEQKLGAGWKAKLSAQAFNTTSAFSAAYPFGTGVDPVTGNTNIASFVNRETNVMRSFDLFAAGPVPLFGRTHQLTTGVSYQTLRSGLHNVFNFVPQVSNVFAPPLPMIVEGDKRQTSYVDTSQFNIYTNARINLADPLTLILGGAVSWWSVRNTYGENTFNKIPNADHITAKVTPFFGLIYDINDNLSAYTSYTAIFMPQTATNAAGRLIGPLRGNQIELGLKGDYLAGRLNTAASIFQINQKNRAIADPANPLSDYQVAAGEARSRGFQLSATGEIAPGWTVFGGYTYTNVMSFDAEDSATGTGGHAFSAIAPTHLLRLWTNYRFRGDLNKLNVGGGVNVSSRYSATTQTDAGSYTLAQGGYATVNLQAGYDITKNVNAQLNVNNLFDRRYYQSLAGIGNGNFLGDPRSVLFTVRIKM
jgi:outer membrane receptor for ferric coprogen and ferric-rhodotorulic acid